MPLRRPVTLAGSRRTAKLFINSSSVSRAHCLFVVTPSGVFVRDLASRGGTQVNGETVVERDLADGDEVQIGPYLFGFRDPRELARPKPRTPESVVLHARTPKGRVKVDLTGARVGVIGAREKSDLHLPFPGVSTTHAAVVRLEGWDPSGGEGFSGWAVYDLGGKGTRLNGEPLKRAKLGPKDRLQVGPVQVALEVVARAEPAPEPAEAPAPKLPPEPTPADTAAVEAEDLAETHSEPGDSFHALPRYWRDAETEDIADVEESEAVEEADTPAAEPVTTAEPAEREEELPAEAKSLEPAEVETEPETEPAIEADEEAEPADTEAAKPLELAEAAPTAEAQPVESEKAEATAETVDEPEVIEPLLGTEEPAETAANELALEIEPDVAAHDEPTPEAEDEQEESKRLLGAEESAEEPAEATADESAEEQSLAIEPEPVADAESPAESPVEEELKLDLADAAEPEGEFDLSALDFDLDADGPASPPTAEPAEPAEDEVVAEADRVDAVEAEPVDTAATATAEAVDEQPVAPAPRRKGGRSRRRGEAPARPAVVVEARQTAEPTTQAEPPASDVGPAPAADAEQDVTADIEPEPELPAAAEGESDVLAESEVRVEAQPGSAAEAPEDVLPPTEPEPDSAMAVAELSEGETAGAEPVPTLPDDETFERDVAALSDDGAGELVDADTVADAVAEVAAETPVETSAEEPKPEAEQAAPGAPERGAWEADWERGETSFFGSLAPLASSPLPQLSSMHPAPAAQAPDDNDAAGHDRGLPSPIGQEPARFFEDDEGGGRVEQPPEGLHGDRDHPQRTASDRRPLPTPPAPGVSRPAERAKPQRVGFAGAVFETDEGITTGPFSSTTLPGAATDLDDAHSAPAVAVADPGLDPSYVIPEASGLLGTADWGGVDTATGLLHDALDPATEPATDPVTLEDRAVTAEPDAEQAGENQAVADATLAERPEETEEAGVGSFLRTIRGGVRPDVGGKGTGESGKNGHARAPTNGHATRQGENGAVAEEVVPEAELQVETAPSPSIRHRPARPPRPRGERQRIAVAMAEPAAARPRSPRLALLAIAMVLSIVAASGAIWLLLAPAEIVAARVRYDLAAAAPPRAVAELEAQQLALVNDPGVRRNAVEILARNAPHIRPDWLANAGEEPGVEARFNPDVAGVLRLTSHGPNPSAETERLRALAAALVKANAETQAQVELLNSETLTTAGEMNRVSREAAALQQDIESLEAELAGSGDIQPEELDELRVRFSTAEATRDAAAERAQEMRAELAALESSEVGEEDAALVSLRRDLAEAEARLAAGDGDASALRERAAQLTRQIERREAELEGEQQSRAQQLRRDAAAAEEEAQRAAREVRQLQTELDELESGGEARRQREAELADKRADRADREVKLEELRLRQDARHARRSELAYPLPLDDADIVHVGPEPDRRIVSMILASLAIFVLFLIPTYFTLRGPRY